ncbi:MAG: pyruvate kinase, partial [Thermodesulfobacteriota bacterium]
MRRTKIICTIGPSTSSVDVLYNMCMAGMNVARINMSHGTHASHEEVIKNIKAVN